MPLTLRLIGLELSIFVGRTEEAQTTNTTAQAEAWSGSKDNRGNAGSDFDFGLHHNSSIEQGDDHAQKKHGL